MGEGKPTGPLRRQDIDLLVDDAPENVARVRAALTVLPDNAAAEVEDLDLQQHTVVHVVDEVIVYLMGRACGLSHADVAPDAESREILGVTIPVASSASLNRTKNTCPQDAIDRAFLEGAVEGPAGHPHETGSLVTRTPVPSATRRLTAR